jgi:hypothetical protein
MVDMSVFYIEADHRLKGVPNSGLGLHNKPCSISVKNNMCVVGAYTSSHLSFPKEGLVMLKNELYIFGYMVIDMYDPTILSHVELSNPSKGDRMYDHVLD